MPWGLITSPFWGGLLFPLQHSKNPKPSVCRYFLVQALLKNFLAMRNASRFPMQLLSLERKVQFLLSPFYVVALWTMGKEKRTNLQNRLLRIYFFTLKVKFHGWLVKKGYDMRCVHIEQNDVIFHQIKNSKSCGTHFRHVHYSTILHRPRMI